MRERVVPGVITALCIVIIAGVLVAVHRSRPAPGPGVTLDNFRRIRLGMTKEEVDRIMGVEPYLKLNAGSSVPAHRYDCPSGHRRAKFIFGSGWKVDWGNYWEVVPGGVSRTAGLDYEEEQSFLQRLWSWFGWPRT